MALLLAGVQLTAQCDVSGHVLSPPNNSYCGKVIYSYDTFGLLVPNDDTVLEGINVGTEIQFSYEIDSVAGACMVGPSVSIGCLEVVTLPSADCVADFTYNTESYDLSPEVSFFPVVINTLLEYTWDFGDGSTAPGPEVTHVFPAQDFYEVCLTISGGNCGQVVNCQTVDIHECHAAFHYEALDGEVNFFNNSTGNYSEWEWDHGGWQ